MYPSFESAVPGHGSWLLAGTVCSPVLILSADCRAERIFIKDIMIYLQGYIERQGRNLTIYYLQQQSLQQADSNCQNLCLFCMKSTMKSDSCKIYRLHRIHEIRGIIQGASELRDTSDGKLMGPASRSEIVIHTYPENFSHQIGASIHAGLQ